MMLIFVGKERDQFVLRLHNKMIVIDPFDDVFFGRHCYCMSSSRCHLYLNCRAYINV